MTLAGDLGMELKTRVHADATAAKGMVERRGISRVRHIEVDHLCIQEQEAGRRLPISKVDSGDNPADLMTKKVGIRITSGITASGKVFEIQDNWRRPGREDREL